MIILLCLFLQWPLWASGSAATISYNSTTIFAVDGNSISVGSSGDASGSTNYFNLLKNETPFRYAGSALVFAVSGQTTQQMTADAVAQVDSVLVPGRRGVLIAWEVTNDIAFNGGDSAQTIYERFRDYCIARRAAGWRVVTLTTLPRTGLNAATINSVNALMKTNSAAFCDAIVDVRTNAAFASDTPDTNYLPDGVHPNATANGIIASMLRPVLLNLKK